MLDSKFWKKNSKYARFVKLDKDLNFEKKSFYILFAPIFLIIAFYVFLKKKVISHPKINFYFFDGISKNCREIKENVTKWKALDIVYNYRRGDENMFADFWHNLRSSQGTRNRLKLAKFLLLKNIKEISEKNKKVRLISIASGLAQGVIETMVEAKQEGILVKAVLIDLDPTAIEHSKKLAQKSGVESQITFINDTVSVIDEIGKEFRPNLIEMVGFLEYRPFDKAVKLVQVIYQSLEREGVFIVSQINPNLERFFLKEVINWPMVYRKPREMAQVLSSAGFSSENRSFYWEPLKIHYIIESRKI